MFEIALTENGTNEEAILGKARAYKRMGYDNKAYDLYENFLKYYGNFSHYADDTRYAYLKQVYNSGYRNYKRGRHYPSIAFFKRLLRFFPGAKKSEDALYWIGESYYSLQKYDSANKYFNRVLANSYHHRNQQARMKKGYVYFMAKRFDLAAREFQVYINDYPKGKYINTAKKWNKMSTREIMYRIKDGKIDDDNNEDDEDEFDDDRETKDSQMDEGDNIGKNEGASRGVGRDYQIIKDENKNYIKLENVAEL